MNWRIRQDSHPQTLRSKELAHGHQDDGNFTTDAETKAEGRMIPHAKRRPVSALNLLHSTFCLQTMGPAERLALPWGECPAVYKTAAVATEPRRRENGLPSRSPQQGRLTCRLHSSRTGTPARQPHSRCAASEGWWVARDLHRALRFKSPLHRCNACNPDTRGRGS